VLIKLLLTATTINLPNLHLLSHLAGLHGLLSVWHGHCNAWLQLLVMRVDHALEPLLDPVLQVNISRHVLLVLSMSQLTLKVILQGGVIFLLLAPTESRQRFILRRILLLLCLDHDELLWLLGFGSLGLVQIAWLL
jgi:hypothetical protein